MGVLGFDTFIAEANLSDEFRARLVERIRHLAEVSLARHWPDLGENPTPTPTTARARVRNDPAGKLNRIR